MASRRKKERDAIKALAAEAKAKAAAEKKALLLAKEAAGTTETTEEPTVVVKAAGVEVVKEKAKIKASDYAGNVHAHICSCHNVLDAIT